jgi:hypothetical protein
MVVVKCILGRLGTGCGARSAKLSRSFFNPTNRASRSANPQLMLAPLLNFVPALGLPILFYIAQALTFSPKILAYLMNLRFRVVLNDAPLKIKQW